jgi:hypothetical protein
MPNIDLASVADKCAMIILGTMIMVRYLLLSWSFNSESSRSFTHVLLRTLCTMTRHRLLQYLQSRPLFISS